ncbi:MAG: DUF421 domain-containing protein [Pseudomonadota bacterium]|nr:DUF421 domain-containing protein [Pseudomonadota bacterium]
MSGIDSLFGSGEALTPIQMVLRALTVFVLALMMIRVAGRRGFGQHNSFDACMSVLLGAVLSRAVVGASPFGATMCAGLAIVALHRGVAWLSIRWPAFDRLVSGSERVLVEDGRVDPREMRRALMGVRDLDEAMRKHFGAKAGAGLDGARTGPDPDGALVSAELLRAVLERDGTVTLARAPGRS